MSNKVWGVVKFITCFLIFSVFVAGGGVKFVYAAIFFSSTVSEIQENLDRAVSNGESDVIIVLPGVYEINHRISYNDLASEEGKALFIGGLGSVLKPIFRRGENSDDGSFLNISSSFGGDIAVADIIFENSRGGGLTIHSEAGGDIRLVNSCFRNNYKIGRGAGANLSCRSGTIEVLNNIFQENSSPGGSGGGLHISSRPETFSAGVGWVPTAEQVGHVRLYNNSFLNNDGGLGGGLFINRRHLTGALIYSNIFWGNTGDPRDFYEEFSDPRSSFFDFGTFLYFNQISDFRGAHGGFLAEYQNDDSDPLMDGFIPRPASPVIDTGPDPAGPLLTWWIEPPVYDYRAKPRIVDGNGDGSALIDRGAIEVDAETGGGSSGGSSGPFRPLRIIPNVPKSVGNLPSAPVKYVRINDVARNSDKRVGWTISPERSTSKTFALYYGDPAVGNYQTGRAANSGVLEFPEMRFQKGDHPFLYFMLYMDTQRDRKVDALRVYANNEVIWEKSPRTVRMKEWQLVGVDLQAYAGKPFNLAIKFDTINGRFNYSEGVYIDDIIISLDGSVPAKYLTQHNSKKTQ